LLDGGDGLVYLGVAEVGRELDGSGLDEIERLSGKDVGEGWRAPA